MLEDTYIPSTCFKYECIRPACTSIAWIYGYSILSIYSCQCIGHLFEHSIRLAVSAFRHGYNSSSIFVYCLNTVCTCKYTLSVMPAISCSLAERPLMTQHQACIGCEEHKVPAVDAATQKTNSQGPYTQLSCQNDMCH